MNAMKVSFCNSVGDMDLINKARNLRESEGEPYEASGDVLYLGNTVRLTQEDMLDPAKYRLMQEPTPESDPELFRPLVDCDLYPDRTIPVEMVMNVNLDFNGFEITRRVAFRPKAKLGQPVKKEIQSLYTV